MGFLERMGLKPEREVIQTDSLDEPTRTALWNLVFKTLEVLRDRTEYGEANQAESFLRLTWTRYFEQPIDVFKTATTVGMIRKQVLSGDWGDALDVIEWVVRAANSVDKGVGSSFSKAVNSELETYLVGYRFVDKRIVPVSNERETEAISSAMTSAGSTGRTHLKRAVELLSNRETPQYAKVVAESISAVESVVAELTGEHVLSSGLKKLDASGAPIHPALAGAWDKLYGYTSDANGIRHGLIRDEDADEPLAIYFLVSCSAFINLLLKVSGK